MSENPDIIYGEGVFPPDGQTHHFAAIHDGTDTGYYVDGVRIHPLTGGDSFGAAE